MTQTVLDPEQTSTGDSELEHLVCCDPDTALCGTDVSASPWGSGRDSVAPEDQCIVCYELADSDGVCPICGK